MRRQFLAMVLTGLFVTAPMALNSGDALQKRTQEFVTETKEPAEKPKESEASITPELTDCTLQIGDRKVKPLASGPHVPSRRAGDLRMVVEANVVTAFKAKSPEKPHWIAKTKTKTHLAWVAADTKVIYLAGFDVDEKERDEKPETPPRVRRLEVESGKWMTDLVIQPKPDPKESENIEAVLTGNDRVVVLSIIADDGKGFEGVGQIIRYRVTCFKAGAEKPLWSKSFPSAGKTARSGVALLWASRSPDQTSSNLLHLSFLDDNVLVCAGAVQDILCLNKDSGKVHWRMPRIWEFERSFVGPSVWQHFFTRAGASDDDGPEDDKRPKKNKKEKDKAKEKQAKDDYYQAIVGGPVVIRSPKKAGGTRIFVAVTKGPAHYASYLGNCYAYELDENGRPVSMAQLPRMVLGGRYQVHKDGLVWACQKNAFVRLAVTDGERGFGIGPGGPDLLCHVDWYRQIRGDVPDAWLRSDPAGSPMTFSDTHAFRITSGGYIVDRAAKTYRFPLSVIDLKTGADRTMVLDVPFKGKVPEPKSNYSQTAGDDGKPRWTTMGPYLMAVTWLKLEDNRLHLTLGMEKLARTLEFDVNDVLGRPR